MGNFLKFLKVLKMKGAQNKVMNLVKSQPMGTAVLFGSFIGLAIGSGNVVPHAEHADGHDDAHAHVAPTQVTTSDTPAGLFDMSSPDAAAPVATTNGVAPTVAVITPPVVNALVPHSPLHGRANDEGLPNTNNVRYFKDYVAGLDYERKGPAWVYQSLTREGYRSDSSGTTVSRKNSRFSDDVFAVPVAFRATNADYKGSGLTRGHMSPAGDSKSSTQQGMDETFLLSSNIIPQEWSSNSNFWYRMEVFARKGITEDFDNVDVVSGPLYLPNDKGVVSYRVIGENKVSVPTHLYKVVSASFPNTEERFQAAFVVPNGETPKDAKITDYQVPIESVEKSAGLEFFASTRANSKDLCDTWDCDKHFLTNSELKEWNLSRRLSWANTEAELIGVWENADTEGIKKSPAAQAMYSKRLSEFEK